jgi:hypothetical protein
LEVGERGTDCLFLGGVFEKEGGGKSREWRGGEEEEGMEEEGSWTPTLRLRKKEMG